MVETIDSDFGSLGFSLKTAYYLGRASWAAYGESGDWPETLGLGDTVRPFDCGDFHGFVAAQQNVAVVAFRGTQTVGNVLTDVETPLVKHESYPGHVHCGFSEATDEVFPIVRALLGIVAKGLPVWITGHSLGGAMATLVSVRLVAEGFRVPAVYTYGSPRPGDRHFRDGYQLPNYRFVNDNDLVPHLPFRWCYKHVGDLKLLDAEGSLLEEITDWRDKKRELRRHAKRVQRAHRKDPDPALTHSEFDWLADHQLARYLAAIRQLLPRVPWRISDEGPSAMLSGVPAAVPTGPSGNPRLVPLHSLSRASDSPVPRPHMLDRGKPRKPKISADQLAEAFLKGPRKSD